MALQFALGLSMISLGIMAGFLGAEFEGTCIVVAGAATVFV